MEIGKIIIEKLTKEELNLLCERWDDGSFSEIMIDKLIPQDVKNYPEQYIDECKCDVCGENL